MAMNGGFMSHYWQNTLTAYHDWNDNLSYGYIADGRGGHRNYFRAQDQNGLYTNTNDKRGVVNLWGSIVQQKRGYLLRNYPISPYWLGRCPSWQYRPDTTEWPRYWPSINR